MKSQINKLKISQIFFLILAILCTIMSVPLLGYLLSLLSFGLVHLLVLTFAIVTLIFALQASAPKMGVLVALAAVVPAMVSAVLMFNGIQIAQELGLDITAPTDMYEAVYSGDLTVFFVGFNIGFLAWALYITAAVMLYLNFSSMRTRYKNIESGSYLSDDWPDVADLGDKVVEEDDIAETTDVEIAEDVDMSDAILSPKVVKMKTKSGKPKPKRVATKVVQNAEPQTTEAVKAARAKKKTQMAVKQSPVTNKAKAPIKAKKPKVKATKEKKGNKKNGK